MAGGMTWKPDHRTLKPFGSFTVVSEVNQDRETAHLVTFPDGSKVRVLPSDGSYRARLVAQVLHRLHALGERLGADLADLVDPVSFFEGQMYVHGLRFERELVRPQTFENFLGEYLDPATVAQLVEAMPQAGWKAERA